MPGWFVCAIFSHLCSVFPNKIDSCNPTTTFSIRNVHVIAVATEVNIFQRPIGLATSSPGIAESQTHLVMINHSTHTAHSRNLIHSRPWDAYLVREPQLSFDWGTRWAFRTWLPHPDTVDYVHSWMCRVRCIILNQYNLDQRSPHHSLASKPVLHLCLFWYCPQWSLSDNLR